MLKRALARELRYRLRHNPVVALLGARQVGKTTLAHQVGDAARGSVYLDLESPEDVARLGDASAFFKRHSEDLVILDEIHRAPDVFAILRGIVDRGRREGKRGGQFLVLGSASPELLRQSSETLAGRISYMEMGGFNALEISRRRRNAIGSLWLRGGFPESYLAGSNGLSLEWLENFIRTYIERDIPQIGGVPALHSARFRKLWTMLAHRQGEQVNMSEFGANLEVGGKTISHYLDILEGMLLLRRLRPWSANTKKRLVKSPRAYIRDSGVVHRLLQINGGDALESHPVVGKSWEGFVLENLLLSAPSRAQACFYRTSGGAEIDLLLRLSDKALWAVEIKKGVAPKISRGFHQACADVGATRKFVVYGGGDDYPAAGGATMTSLPSMMRRLRKLRSPAGI